MSLTRLAPRDLGSEISATSLLMPCSLHAHILRSNQDLGRGRLSRDGTIV